jgi:hypothetical protein
LRRQDQLLKINLFNLGENGSLQLQLCFVLQKKRKVDTASRFTMANKS